MFVCYCKKRYNNICEFIICSEYFRPQARFKHWQKSQQNPKLGKKTFTFIRISSLAQLGWRMVHGRNRNHSSQVNEIRWLDENNFHFLANNLLRLIPNCIFFFALRIYCWLGHECLRITLVKSLKALKSLGSFFEGIHKLYLSLYLSLAHLLLFVIMFWYNFLLHFLNIASRFKFSEYNFLQTLGENYWEILFALESRKHQKEIDPCLLPKSKDVSENFEQKTSDFQKIFPLSANTCHLRSENAKSDEY